MFKHLTYATLALSLACASAFAQVSATDANSKKIDAGQSARSNTTGHNPSSAADVRESIKDGKADGHGALTSGFINGTRGVTPEDIVESGGTRH